MQLESANSPSKVNLSSIHLIISIAIQVQAPSILACTATLLILSPHSASDYDTILPTSSASFQILFFLCSL